MKALKKKLLIKIFDTIKWMCYPCTVKLYSIEIQGSSCVQITQLCLTLRQASGMHISKQLVSLTLSTPLTHTQSHVQVNTHQHMVHAHPQIHYHHSLYSVYMYILVLRMQWLHFKKEVFVLIRKKVDMVKISRRSLRNMVSKFSCLWNKKSAINRIHCYCSSIVHPSFILSDQ